MVKTKIFETEEQAIAGMKHDLEYLYGATCEREWLEAIPEDSYHDETYRVSVAVLSGSPPKGIMVLNRAYGKVMGFDAWFKPVFLYKFGINHQYLMTKNRMAQLEKEKRSN